VAVIPFEEIVAEHGPTVLRVCRAVLGSADAEDAWSETFLSAMRAYPGLRPGSNVQAWLVTIAKHKAIDTHRRRARLPVPVDDIQDRPEPSPDVTGFSDGHDVTAALETLPGKQREAVAYHYLSGLPYAEVGRILGTNEAAARRAAADGIKKLRATYLRTTDLKEVR
jgi:RNA polymerase sigma factor (sigma-70 family)